MVDATALQSKPQSLGVAGVLGSTFSIFFSRFGTFFLLGFLPALVVLAINFLLIGPSALGAADPQEMAELFSSPAGIALFVVGSLLLPLVGYAISTSMIVRAAYDAKLNRPTNLGAYVGPALAKILPIVLTSLAIMLIVVLAAALVVAPGAALAAAVGPEAAGLPLVLFGIVALVVVFYLYATYFVAIPAIVIENIGLGAIGRSWGLTRNYRWSVIGAFFILVLFLLGFQFLVGFALLPVLLEMGPVIAIGASAVINGVLAGVIAVFSSVLYARLREIKEGASVDDLATVFA